MNTSQPSDQNLHKNGETAQKAAYGQREPFLDGFARKSQLIGVILTTLLTGGTTAWQWFSDYEQQIATRAFIGYTTGGRDDGGAAHTEKSGAAQSEKPFTVYFVEVENQGIATLKEIRLLISDPSINDETVIVAENGIFVEMPNKDDNSLKPTQRMVGTAARPQDPSPLQAGASIRVQIRVHKADWSPKDLSYRVGREGQWSKFDSSTGLLAKGLSPAIYVLCAATLVIPIVWWITISKLKQMAVDFANNEIASREHQIRKATAETLSESGHLSKPLNEVMEVLKHANPTQ